MEDSVYYVINHVRHVHLIHNVLVVMKVYLYWEIVVYRSVLMVSMVSRVNVLNVLVIPSIILIV